LWAILDATFPLEDVPDAFTRASRQHEAYAAPRRWLYLGGDQYLATLDAAVGSSRQRILVEGASGGGKSALLANWISAWRSSHPQDLVHEHYLAATSEAAGPAVLVRRLVEAIRRTTDCEEPIAGESQELFESLPTWLAAASAHADQAGARWLIVLDGLNGLNDLQDLRWLPAFLPDRVHLIVSCLPGPVHDSLDRKGPWHRIPLEPLGLPEAQALLVRYLGQYNKTLAPDQLRRALSHPLAANPLFLRTLAEELRVFGVYEQLAARLGHYLESRTVPDLFECVLERVEEDYGTERVRQAITGIWASRSGLSENEVQGFAHLVPATWAPIRHAMSEALLETNGRLTFAHDYLRRAVEARYLQSAEEQRTAHRALAEWFAGQAVNERVAEELPWQWQHADAPQELESCLATRPLFETMFRARTDAEQELLGYWLYLEGEPGQRIDACYESAWTQWTERERGEPGWESAERQLAWAKLAENLGSFLRVAGRYGELTASLVETELELRQEIRGEDHTDTADSLKHYAWFLERTNKPEPATPFYRRALAIREKIQGAEHRDTVESIRNLAASLRRNSEYTEAEQQLRRALEITQRTRAEHVDGQLYNSLAVLLMERGDHRGCETAMRRAVEISERTKGREHPTTLAVLRNMAGMLGEMGNPRSAEPLYRQVLKVQERILGMAHPDTLSSRMRLAGLLGDLGEYESAETLFRQVLDIQESVLGPDHLDVAATLSNLARLLHARANYADALALARRSTQILETVYGLDHPRATSGLANLATLLSDSGDREGAEPLYRQVLATRERVLGSEHPDTALSLSNLAVFLEEGGDAEVAIPLLRRALAIEEKTLGPEHPKVGLSLDNLAGMLRDAGDVDAAIPLARRALAIAESALGAEHPDTASPLTTLADALERKGDYENAEVLYRRALQIKEASHGPEYAMTTLQKLAGVLAAKEDYGEAETHYRRLADIADKVHGPVHESTAACLNELGAVLNTREDFDQAESVYRRALDIIDTLKGTEHASAVTSLDGLGSALRAKGEFQAAVPYFQRSLGIREKELGHVHAGTATGHSTLARMLRLSGSQADAELHYRQALEIHEQIAGPQDTGVGLMAYHLGSLCLEQERFSEAEGWYRRALLIEEAIKEPDDPDLALTRYDLGKTLGFIAAQENDPRRYEEAAALLRQALQGCSRDRDEETFGKTHAWLGTVLSALAEFDDSKALWNEAMASFAAVLEVWPDDPGMQERFRQARERARDLH
jgi:tetratricopeptide (TPR) repeat protein